LPRIAGVPGLPVVPGLPPDCKSLDVTLLDPSEEILARIRIQNGTHNATFKDNEKFAEDAGDAIGDLITGKTRK
jgi:hypothetical protein